MAISVEVDKISPSLPGLVLGCVLRYGKDGPVRFIRVLVPWRTFTADVRAGVLAAFDRALEQEPEEDDPLF